MPRLDDAALDTLFRTARSYNSWYDRPLEDQTIRELYELTKLGPTATNSSPARFVFLRTTAAKERVKPHLMPGNVEKTLTAPCCVIVAYDSRFYELMPKLFPSRDFTTVFGNNPTLVAEICQRNSSLQGAYFIIAARALGLDCGPMSGFNRETLDADFFPDGRWRSNFLCNIGYGSEEKLFPRNPRLDFSDACLEL